MRILGERQPESRDLGCPKCGRRDGIRRSEYKLCCIHCVIFLELSDVMFLTPWTIYCEFESRGGGGGPVGLAYELDIAIEEILYMATTRYLEPVRIGLPEHMIRYMKDARKAWFGNHEGTGALLYKNVPIDETTGDPFIVFMRPTCPEDPYTIYSFRFAQAPATSPRQNPR